MKVSKRMILGCILAVLVLPLVGAVSDASAQNLLVNPRFETGDLTGWQVFGLSPSSFVSVLSPDNGPSQGGTHHAFMDNQAQGLGLTLKQSTAAGSAGPGTVDFAFDLKLGQQANSGVFFVEIFAEQAGGGVLFTQTFPNFAPAGWVLTSGSFVAPAGTDFLTIQFLANTGAVVGAISSMQVDNVYLSQNGPPVASESMTWGSTKALFR